MRTAEPTDRIRYIRELYCKEDNVLQKVDQTIQQYEQPIHISPEDAKFLRVLLKLAGAKNGVELGSLAGYSTIWLARALPADGKLYSIERSQNRYDMTKASLEMSDVNNKVDLIFGDAEEKLKELSAHGPFDFIFIDANKSGYLNYLDWADGNLKSGGLIIADNTMLFDEVYKEKPVKASKTAHQVMKDFNIRLANESKYETIMLPTDDGMTISIKL